MIKPDLLDKDGIWVTYSWEYNAVVHRVHSTVIDAVMALDWGERIAYWPFGMDLQEAIKTWEAAPSKESTDEA